MFQCDLVEQTNLFLLFSIKSQSLESSLFEWKKKNPNYSNNLPKEAEHKVRFAFAQIVSVDIDDIAADGLCRIKSQRQILVHRVDGQVFLVDCSFVDRIRTRMIDDFATFFSGF